MASTCCGKVSTSLQLLMLYVGIKSVRVAYPPCPRIKLTCRGYRRPWFLSLKPTLRFTHLIGPSPNLFFFCVFTVVWQPAFWKWCLDRWIGIQMVARRYLNVRHNDGASKQPVIWQAAIRAHDGLPVPCKEMDCPRRTNGWYLAGEHGNAVGFHQSSKFGQWRNNFSAGWEEIIQRKFKLFLLVLSEYPCRTWVLKSFVFCPYLSWNLRCEISSLKFGQIDERSYFRRSYLTVSDDLCLSSVFKFGERAKKGHLFETWKRFCLNFRPTYQEIKEHAEKKCNIPLKSILIFVSVQKLLAFYLRWQIFSTCPPLSWLAVVLFIAPRALWDGKSSSNRGWKALTPDGKSPIEGELAQQTKVVENFWADRFYVSFQYSWIMGLSLLCIGVTRCHIP